MPQDIGLFQFVLSNNYTPESGPPGQFVRGFTIQFGGRSDAVQIDCFPTGWDRRFEARFRGAAKGSKRGPFRQFYTVAWNGEMEAGRGFCRANLLW